MSRGSLFVKLERGEYFPGEQVNGAVYLDLRMPFPSSQVMIGFDGKEEVHLVQELRHRQEGQADRVEHIPHTEAKNFFHNEFPIFTSQQHSIEPGQFSFPFSFALHQGLPSSFSHEFGMHAGQCYGRVKFRVEAFLVNPQNPSERLSFTQPLLINQPVHTGTQAHNLRMEKHEDIGGCCFVSHGRTSLVTWFEKNEYTVGETAHMISEVDNSQCTVGIKSIKGVFSQTIALRASGFTHNIRKELMAIDMPGLDPGSTRNGQQATRTAIPLVSPGQQMLEGSTKGQLVSNTFNLENTLDMDACQCCTSPPRCCMEVLIKEKSLAYPPWAQMPPGWAPQQMPPQSFQLTPATQEMNPHQNFSMQGPSMMM